MRTLLDAAHNAGAGVSPFSWPCSGVARYIPTPLGAAPRPAYAADADADAGAGDGDGASSIRRSASIAASVPAPKSSSPSLRPPPGPGPCPPTPDSAHVGMSNGRFFCVENLSPITMTFSPLGWMPTFPSTAWGGVDDAEAVVAVAKGVYVVSLFFFSGDGDEEYDEDEEDEEEGGRWVGCAGTSAVGSGCGGSGGGGGGAVDSPVPASPSPPPLLPQLLPLLPLLPLLLLAGATPSPRKLRDTTAPASAPVPTAEEGSDLSQPAI